METTSQGYFGKSKSGYFCQNSTLTHQYATSLSAIGLARLS
jgi:hypothetical protein